MRPPPPPPDWASSLVSIGVTGTNGKTSTTGMLAELLAVLARPVARVTTLGSFLDQRELEVPAHYAGFLATMQRCREEGGRYAALELTSEALALGFARSWPLRGGVFTNLSPDHSDVHPTVEHYLAAKAQLFMALPPGGFAVLNAHDEAGKLLAEVVPAGVELLSYGVASRGRAWREPDLAARDVRVSAAGTRIELAASARFPDLPPELSIQAVGEVFAENALAALAAGLAMGVPGRAAAQALQQVTPPPGRFQLVRERPCVVVDYAHTPDALVRTLATARRLARRHVVLVFGAGGERDRQKRPLLGAAARVADRIFLTSDNPRSEDPSSIIEQLAQGVGSHSGLVKEPDRAKAILDALNGALDDDLVLIAGKGHELFQENAGQRVAFSDVAVVRAWGVRADVCD